MVANATRVRPSVKFTDPQRRRLGNLFRRQHGLVAIKYAAVLERFWKAQAERVLERLGLKVEAVDPIPDIENLLLSNAARSFIVATAEGASEIAGSLVDVEPLTAADREMLRLLAEAGGRIVNINDITRARVQTELSQGFRAGYNDFQLAEGVEKDGYRGIRAVVQMTYRNRNQTIARTEMAITSQQSAHGRYGVGGVSEIDILDGPDCGWTFHDDPDVADGSRRTLAAAEAQPISHPNCVRVSLPVLPS